MSTYTDLHNKIKETLNVDYISRESLQEVHLKNLRNEYYGTFKGTFESEGINVNGGTLKDVVLDGVTLKNVSYPGGIDFDQIGTQVSQISSDQLQCSENISTLDSKINSETSQRKEIDINLNNKIDSLSTTVKNNLTAIASDIYSDVEVISIDLKNQIENVNNNLSNISTDIVLSIDKLNLSVETEKTDRQLQDNTIIGYINSETSRAKNIEEKLSILTLSVDNNSIERLAIIRNELNTHSLENNEQFSKAHNEMLSTVERERHYSINSGSIEQSYPYILKDFAVNRITTNIIDKVVKYNDEIIGQIDEVIGQGDEGVKGIQVKFYNLEKFDQLLVAISSYDKYLFSGTNSHLTKNGYSISYDASVQKIILQNSPENYYAIYDEKDSSLIGKIYEPEFNSDKKLISGKLSIEKTNDSLLTEFISVNKAQFDVENNKITVNDTNEILFNFDEQNFIFRTGVSIKYYCPLSTENGDLVAQIFKGNVKYDGSQISSIGVTLDGNLYADLRSENQFSAEYSPNTILSCNIATKQFVKYNVNAQYKYEIYLTSDVEYSGISYGYVVLTSENGDINIENYDEISVIYNYNTEYVELNNIYLLRKSTDVNLNLWVYESPVSENGDKMKVSFDGQCVIFNGIIAGGIINTKYSVKKSQPEIYNTDSYLSQEWITTEANLTRFDAFKPQYNLQLTSIIDNEQTSPEHKCHSFNIEQANIPDIECIIPSRTSNNISRELIIVCNFISNVSHKNIKFKYVSDNCLCLRDAKINDTNNSVFKIPMNKEVVLKIKELDVGHFEVIDIRENSQYDLIKNLQSDLLSLSNNVNTISDLLSDEIDTLSVNLSAEIIDLSTALSTEIDILSSALSTEIDILSVALSDEIDTLSVNLSAEIIDLSTALSTEIDDLSIKLDSRITTNKENIDILINRLQGGIFYKGHIQIDDETETFVDAISSLYMNNDTTPNEILSKPLSSGWYYVVNTPNIEKHYNIEGKNVEHKDWIVITEDIILSNITTSNIDIVDFMDEDVVTKTLANNLSTLLELSIINAYDKLDDKIELCSDILFDEIGDLSNDLSNEIRDRSSDLYYKINKLENELDEKIYIDNIPLNDTNLSLVHINQTDYNELVKTDSCLSNTLYVISGDYVDMYNEQLKNLAEPTDDSDATTKKYVDTSVNQLDEQIKKIKNEDITYLSSELSDYHNTLSGIDRNDHFKNVGHTIETDNLMLTDVSKIDEGDTHNKYYMTMLSGTLVLKQI